MATKKKTILPNYAPPPQDLSELDWHEGMVPPHGFPDWRTWHLYLDSQPKKFITTLSERQILKQLLPRLSRKQISELRHIAQGMIEGQGRPSPKLKLALTLKYKAAGDKWEVIARKVNSETNSSHDWKHYERLYRRNRGA